MGLSRRAQLIAQASHKAESVHSNAVELAQGEVPEWIHLFPEGPLVQGRDGREFNYDAADAGEIIADTELPLALDVDHESIYWRGSTKAYGWVEELVYDDGSGDRAAGFWGRVRFTEEGARLVAAQEFRFLSPVVRVLRVIEEDEDGNPFPPQMFLLNFINVALTNRPNLVMTALNTQQPEPPAPTKVTAPLAQKETGMNPEFQKLAQRLGLSEKATEAELLMTIMALADESETLKQEVEELTKERDEALALVKANEESEFQSKVEAVLNAAAECVGPANVEDYRKLITDEASLATFEKIVAKMQPLTKSEEKADLPETQSDEDKEFETLTDSQKRIGEALGPRTQSREEAANG
ncbi:MAG: phage protease [Myxococcota bacterium]